MNRTRWLLGAAGVAIIGYGAWRILGTARLTRPRTLGLWLMGALIVHDGVVAPVTSSAGWLLGRISRPRARRYLSGALVAGAIVTAVALPLIHRRGHAQPGSTLLTRNYETNLTLILSGIAAVAVVAYLQRLIRDRRAQTGQRSSETNVRPPDDQDSAST
ncbi:MAG TPA: hypothetical protein VJ831_15360 [Jatrophihabitantaceae bacterium]|nr:hypothetical protein [Jatrophihabitantaceae bacterium]